MYPQGYRRRESSLTNSETLAPLRKETHDGAPVLVLVRIFLLGVGSRQTPIVDTACQKGEACEAHANAVAWEIFRRVLLEERVRCDDTTHYWDVISALMPTHGCCLTLTVPCTDLERSGNRSLFVSLDWGAYDRC